MSSTPPGGGGDLPEGETDPLGVLARQQQAAAATTSGEAPLDTLDPGLREAFRILEHQNRDFYGRQTALLEQLVRSLTPAPPVAFASQPPAPTSATAAALPSGHISPFAWPNEMQFLQHLQRVKFEPCDVTSSRLIRNWVSQTKLTLKINHVDPGHPSVIGKCGAALQGMGVTWFRDMCAQSGDDCAGGFSSFDEFAAALTERFRNPSEPAKVSAALANIQQSSRESVVEYEARFLQLLDTASPALRTNELNRVEFLRGLKPDIANLVHAHPSPMNFAETRAMAVRIGAPRHSLPAASQPTASSSATPMELGITQAALNEAVTVALASMNVGQHKSGKSRSATPGPRGRSRSRSASRSPSQRSASLRSASSSYDRGWKPGEKEALRAVEGCFYCRKPHAGHIAENCPLKRQGRDRSRSPARSSRGN